MPLVPKAESVPINAHIALFSSPGPWLFEQPRRPGWYFVGGVQQLSLAHLENRPGLGTRVVEDKGLMNDRHELASIREASRVSSTNVRIGHIVPALGDAFADSLKAPLRIIQTNEEQSGEKGSFQRSSNRIVRPVASEGGFDCEALAGSKILRASAKNFPSCRDPSPLRKLRTYAPGDRIGFEQVFPALELDLPDQTALSGAIRPGKNGQNRHVSGCRPIQLADHTIVAFTRSSGNEAHFKFSLVGEICG